VNCFVHHKSLARKTNALKMSHSSLSAQLASLHSKNTTSSRQHKDAIGRGIHHSAQAGHAILQNSTSHKPSVLHADARAAAFADVPFTILRENAILSLQFLSQRSSQLFDISGQDLPWQTLFGAKSVKYERGLNTPETNERFDNLVKNALYILSTAWGDAASTIEKSSSTFVQLGGNIPSSVLHTLEYLVQKYYAHVYNAEDLLVAFLPHHETFLFDRLLQLIDLSQLPQWAFLRPYSAAVGVNGVPRTAIAKWAASTKDNGGGATLVKHVCALAKRSAKIHSLERNISSTRDALQVRRGVSLLLSFAAAIVAETFHIQHASTGSIDESTVRCVVPFVLAAVEPSNSKRKKWSLGAQCLEWRSFGQIMISLMVEKSCLSPELCDGLTIGVLRGAMESIDLTRSESLGEAESGSSASLQTVLDTSSGAILAVLSLVMNDRISEETTIENNLNSFLTIISTKNEGSVGCHLSYPAFRSLMKLPFLPATLGYLSEERDVDVDALVGCIIAMTMSSYKSKVSKKRDREHFIQVLSDMINENSLRSIWSRSDRSFIPAACALIVSSVNDVHKNDVEVTAFAGLLSSMRDVHASGCDTGVAHAVTLVASMPDSREKNVAGQSMQKLLEAAGLIQAQEVSVESRKKSQREDSLKAFDDFDSMLPSRVALEHPTAQLRKEAIAKLIAEVENDDSADDVATALIRRYVSDDNLSVTTAAANAIVEIASNGSIGDLYFLQNDVMKEVLKGIQRLTIRSTTEFDDDYLCSSIRLTGYVTQVTRKNLDLDADDLDDENFEPIHDIYNKLVEELVSLYVYFDQNEETVTKYIDKTMITALHDAVNEGTMAKAKATILKQIIKSEPFLRVLRRYIFNINGGGKNLLYDGSLIWFFLQNAAKLSPKSLNDELRECIIDASLVALRQYNGLEDNIKSKENEDGALVLSLTTGLKKSLSDGSLEEVVRLVSRIVNVESDKAFIEVSLKVLDNLKDYASLKTSAGAYPFILIEVLSQKSSTITGIKRLINIIKEFLPTLKSEDCDSIFRCHFVAGIVLCGHSEMTVRECALNFIAWLSELIPDGSSTSQALLSISKTACIKKSLMHSNMMMDGSSALPQMLSKAVHLGKHGSVLRSVIFEACVDLVTNHLLGEGIGNMVASILNATESAGEKSFPLSERWSSAGKPVFEKFLERSSPKYAFYPALVDSVVVMIKGVQMCAAATDEGIVITTGPSQSGRRRRAYSIGMSDITSYIYPYPTDMKEATLSLLLVAIGKPQDTFICQLCETFMRLVLGRSSWASQIFTQIDDATRNQIVESLLTLRSDGNMESAGKTLLGLQLHCHEFVNALSSETSRASNVDAGGLLAFTVLTDCIRAQSTSLSADKNISALTSLLFEKLSLLSHGTKPNDGSDYARTCIISTLSTLAESSSLLTSSGSGNVEFADEVSSHSKLLVSLLGSDDADLKPLASSKSKSLCLQLLTHLCAISPSCVVDSLVPALINTISGEAANSNVTKGALMAIVPAYCAHAQGAGLSLLNLLKAFISKIKKGDGASWHTRLELCICLNEALMSCQDINIVGNAVATLVTVYLASEASADQHDDMIDSEETPISFVAHLLAQVDGEVQISSSLQILQYVGKVMPYLQSKPRELMEEEENFYTVSGKEIFDLALVDFVSGKKETSNTTIQKQIITPTWLVLTLLDIVKEIYATPIVKRIARQSNDQQAGICLNVWQELMTLQSNVSNIRFEESNQNSSQDSTRNKLWSSLGEEVNIILLNLQRLLPAPHFLASVSSLMNNSNVEVDIQTRAILLLAERSTETDPSSPEATLFLDVLPELVKLSNPRISKNTKSDSYRRDSALCQSSYKAIDQFARSFGLAVIDEKLSRKRAQAFMPAFQAVASCLSRVANSINFADDGNENNSTSFHFTTQTQTLTSAALCASSLVTLLKAKCLPLLPKVLKPLSRLLESSNSYRIKYGKGEENDMMQSIRLIQLSTLRALVAVAENIPQFLIPYIEKLLAPEGLPATCLRAGDSDEDIAVSSMADRLDHAIGSRSPVRQLIPILNKATSNCLRFGSTNEENWHESLFIFKILQLAIGKASRADLGPMAGKVINSLAQAYSFQCNVVARCELLTAANKTMLTMVMKLSEAQLRPLYAKLRKWRGDLDVSHSDFSDTLRRNAFWSLSAAMSKELRSIFLPCMGSVVGDIIKELEDAVSCLCISSKASNGKKRQKLIDDSPDDKSSASLPLQSLLLCLESALKADAHDGGNWIRSDDGERYRAILRPLGKLLAANIAQDCFILPLNPEDSVSAYERLVQGVGTEDYGSVVSCLTSLAAAAGNEQLWKPLNHMLLEACGNDRRSDVRKSGVKCLLSIIHTLGEEYMVLLPECLPVLSELLEDDDEEIVALAKECVQQGEELLGESLEDSLR